MSSFDYNADNYTISELLGILDLDDPTSDEIIDKTNNYINRFSNENRPELINFLKIYKQNYYNM